MRGQSYKVKCAQFGSIRRSTPVGENSYRRPTVFNTIRSLMLVAALLLLTSATVLSEMTVSLAGLGASGDTIICGQPVEWQDPVLCRNSIAAT